MFRNLRLYRVHSPWPDSEEALSARLETTGFRPCGASAERSGGWETPAPDYPQLARRVGGADLFQLREQSRVLPASAVNEALDERLVEFETRMRRRPTRAEKRELRDEVYTRLLPNTLVKSDRIPGFHLVHEDLLGIGSASEPAAERFLDTLRDALGGLHVTPLAFATSVGTLLANVYLDAGPRTLSVGRECRMVDPAGSAASVVWNDITITDASVRRHVRDGLKVDRLALSYGEIMTFVLDQDGVMRKIRLSGDELSDDPPAQEDPLAGLDARFVLLTGTVSRLVRDLKHTLGGYAHAG